MAQATFRVLSVDVGERNLGLAIWEVHRGSGSVSGSAQGNTAQGNTAQGNTVTLSYLACHDVLQAVGCTAKCRSVTKVDSVRHMCTFLSRNQALWAPETITDFVVEGQVRASPKNQCLTAALFSWFTLVDRSGTSGPAPRMASISAKNKVKGDAALAIDKKDRKGKAAKKGAEYRQRKKGAVTCLADLISTGAVTVAHGDVLQQWRAAKKKDDMADAALQGLWYIENKLKVKAEK